MTAALLRAVLAMYVYQTSVLLKCRDEKKRRRARRAISRLNESVRVKVIFYLCAGVLFSACAPPLKLDASCILRPGQGVMVMNCADAETWREWNEKQVR